VAFDFKKFGHPSLDVMFPRNCVIAGEPVDENSPYQFISEAAASKIFEVNPPHCQTCGYPYFGAVMASDRACPKCKELNPVYRQGKTVILVEGVGRELIHKFKYEGAEYLLQDFISCLKIVPDLPTMLTVLSLSRCLSIHEKTVNGASIKARRFARR